MRSAVRVLLRAAVVLSLTSALSAGSFALSACSKRVDEPQSEFKPTEAPPLPPGPEKLEIVDETPGSGPEAKKGDTVKVHYTGTLLNGKQFDSSRGKEPFQVTIGAGQVIKGWDEGLPGMRVGMKRKLTIPWQMAYGDKGSGASIPPKAALRFDVELMEIVGADAGAAPAKDAKAAAPAKDAGAPKPPPAKDAGAAK
jgi:FKBP-type peptidyl-prolyl cis-trans isomerase FkpA